MSRIVVALGGNAILEGGEGTVEKQRRSIRKTIPKLVELTERGHDLVLTHGNGPQVGQLLLQNEATDSVEPRPLDVLGAESQAQIGYLFQQEFRNQTGTVPVTTITQTRVDPEDPAFENPTKPVGPYYDEDEVAEKDFEVTKVNKTADETAYRRVVPSPAPLEIVESEHITQLVDDGRTVICTGGGGVPVVESDGDSEGIEGVIDKDQASAVLAGDVDADEFLVLTDVEAAYQNYGTEDEQRIDEVTPEEARELFDEGIFGEGSMAPKVKACIEFAENGGDRAMITNPEHATEAIAGEAGTTVVSPESEATDISQEDEATIAQ